jgi:protein-tyrosine-phosphatase
MLAVGLLLLPGLAAAACPARKVLFVCPAGTVKSAIAREALRKRAAALAIPVDVRSRGLSIEDHLYPELAERLDADGLTPSAEPARPLAPADARWADIVIAFDEAASAPGLARARAWRTPSWNADYDRAKTDLDQRLDVLLTELAKRPCASVPATR